MKKSRKSKIVLLSVLGLATVSLATVGFASWVISDITPASDQNITATVGGITDNTLTAKITNAELAVKFDNTLDGSTFTNGDKSEEDLEFGFTVTVTGSEDVLNGLSIEFAPATNFASLVGTEEANKYITMPYSGSNTVTVSKDAKTVATLANGGSISYTRTSDTVHTYTCKFKFGWGAAFGNVNPGKSTIGTSILVERLNAFKAAFNNVESTCMTVTVTPVAVAASV